MIWTLSTVDLMEKYSKRNYDKVQKTNYILISSRVITTKARKNVLNASNLFVNSGMLKGVRFESEPGSVTSREEFKSFLLRNPKSLSLLCSMVEASILDNEDTVMICSPNEMNCKYMDEISIAIEELFGFPVCRYPKERPYDVEEVVKRVIYYKENIDRMTIFFLPESDKLKKIQSMGKKRLKSELKREGLYFKGMDKEEMVEALFEFYKKEKV